MDPNFPFFDNSEEFVNPQNYSNSQFYYNSQDSANPHNISNFENDSNSQISPNHNFIPTSENIQSSQNISRNLFQDFEQTQTNTQKESKCATWLVKEDVALKSSYIFVSEDSVRGNNQKGTVVWSKVAKLFDQARMENPEEIRKRNTQMCRSRYIRLNDNVNKWIAAYREAYGRRRSGMSKKDIEIEAHTIYEAGGSKFTNLHVFEEVMSKHSKWELHLNRNATRAHSEYEESTEESRDSSKRSRTNEGVEHSTPSNLETPIGENSSILRPEGRDATKRKGKGKVSELSHISDDFTVEIHALRLTRNNEVELMNKLGNERIELERKKEENKIEMERRKDERKIMKMNVILLNTLLAKDSLSPQDEEMKRLLVEKVFGK